MNEQAAAWIVDAQGLAQQRQIVLGRPIDQDLRLITDGLLPGEWSLIQCQVPCNLACAFGLQAKVHDKQTNRQGRSKVMEQHIASPMITARGLSKEYKKGAQRITPLENLDLSVRSGEFVAP